MIGKIIHKLFINDDQSLLVFHHSDGSHTAYKTEQEVSSETWFADITSVANLLGSKVLNSNNVKLPSVNDGRTREFKDEFYGIKLLTGRIVVVTKTTYETALTVNQL